MSKTMRQIANEANISKMTVYRIVTREHIKGRYGNDRALHFDNTAEKAILSALEHAKTRPSYNRKRNDVTSRDTVSDTQDTDLVIALNERIKSQQQQIDQLTRLLDQSQQLQLMAERKLKRLEQPQNRPENSSDSPDKKSNEETSGVSQTTENHSERAFSFWQRVFGAGK